MLAREEAIRISIELWEWLAETGSRYKTDWPGWDKYYFMSNDCPLCEYTPIVSHAGCPVCPYYRQFGRCMDGPYFQWSYARNSEERKRFAHKFLEQLRVL